jgi:hypothetical protein
MCKENYNGRKDKDEGTDGRDFQKYYLIAVALIGCCCDKVREYPKDFVLSFWEKGRRLLSTVAERRQRIYCICTHSCLSCDLTSLFFPLWEVGLPHIDTILNLFCGSLKVMKKTKVLLTHELGFAYSMCGVNILCATFG